MIPKNPKGEPPNSEPGPGSTQVPPVPRPAGWEQTMSPEDSEGQRQILFTLDLWEIVLFKSYTKCYAKCYAVHTCPPEEQIFPRGTGTLTGTVHQPRAITRASQMERAARGTRILCWCCEVVVPDDIITITELYNG
jgi:hypothetical protein